MELKIGLIGGGQMAEAIISGLLNKKVVKNHEVTVSEPNEERRNLLNKTYGIKTIFDNQEIIDQCDYIILAVKPQFLIDILEDLDLDINEEKVFISLVAGITIEKLERLLPENAAIIRTVPNTPCLIGEGITALAPNNNVDEEILIKVQEIFKALGEFVVLPESLLNGVTALSGSGPAYVYLFIETLVDAGVSTGLPREIAKKLAVHTLLGASNMVKLTDKHTSELKDMVTSPAGTTIEALHVLERNNFRGTIFDGVIAAFMKAEELSTK